MVSVDGIALKLYVAILNALKFHGSSETDNDLVKIKISGNILV